MITWEEMLLLMAIVYKINLKGSKALIRKSRSAGSFSAWLLVLGVLLIASTANSATYIVSEKSDDYSIQSAINKAMDGDRILVKSGTYSERVNVTKRLIIRGVDTGKGLPIVNANGRRDAITLIADGVWLEGFSVINSGSASEDSGIKVLSKKNIVRGNNLNNNSYGLFLKNSSYNIIESNHAWGNDLGIALQSAKNNTIKDNYVANNFFAGIFSGNSWNNTIRNNSVHGNSWVGILFNNTERSLIEGNMAFENANAGVWVRNSRYNQIKGNNASYNPIYGFLMDRSFNNTLYMNTADGNFDGISMDLSNDNLMLENNISSNKFGIYLDRSDKNWIYLNNFNYNVISAYSYNSSNQWTSDKAFSYLYRGIISWNSMGNFWHDYEGDDSFDTGIGTSAYVYEFIRDEAPLTSMKENYKILK
jgi:nitrous oxidase accessory protein